MKAFDRNLKECYPRVYAAAINKPVLLYERAAIFFIRQHIWHLLERKDIKINMNIWKERLQVFFSAKDLLFQLVQRDVKLKYRRSFLGYVWSVLNPLLIMLVMTVVFLTMFQRKITNYPGI